MSVKPPGPGWQAVLPADSLVVGLEEAFLLTPSLLYDGPLEATVEFYLAPEAGQEGVPPEQKRYRVAGGEGYDRAFVYMDIFTADTWRIGHFIRSVLGQ
jgi:hypothetical protein